MVAVLVAIVFCAGAATWLHAESASSVGPNTASPAYIVVKTPTPVTFTSVIADSNLRKHDPKRVLLVRTDASGSVIDIVGRMNDRGRRADANRNDHTYTLLAVLNEPSVGTTQFRVAAKFRNGLLKGKDDDEDWDRLLAALNELKARMNRRERLLALLRRLQPYTLSDPVQVTIDPFPLPPDPGEAGKQTLQGIDSDSDGVRDDVQRYIAYAAPTSVDLRKALSQLAIANQQFILAAEQPDDVLFTTVETRHRAQECLYSKEPDGLRLLALQRALKAEMLNSSARTFAYIQADSRLSGVFLSQLDLANASSSCIL